MILLRRANLHQPPIPHLQLRPGICVPCLVSDVPLPHRQSAVTLSRLNLLQQAVILPRTLPTVVLSRPSHHRLAVTQPRLNRRPPRRPGIYVPCLVSDVPLPRPQSAVVLPRLNHLRQVVIRFRPNRRRAALLVISVPYLVSVVHLPRTRLAAIWSQLNHLRRAVTQPQFNHRLLAPLVICVPCLA